MLNDGTDEIFNLNGIVCTSLEEFQSAYKDIFDGDSYDYRFYYIVDNEWDCDKILDASNKSNGTDGEQALLSQLQHSFMTYKALRNKLPQKK